MPVTSTSSETIADIVGVHREMTEQYKKALKEKTADLDIRSIFERIVELSRKASAELTRNIVAKEKATHTKADHSIFSPVPSNTGRREVLAICLRNVLSVLNVYTTAISFTRNVATRKFLEDQLEEIRQLHAHIKKYHDAS